MPRITKARIVNYQYNSGNRMIADELFDFEKDGGLPTDVLINLQNGGGKTVLVQLMMQPVLPKAKVAGRKIEYNITKPTDHWFVVLEWALDNSKMRLMTGISMAASDADADADADRGFQVKYYTFLSSYPKGEGEYTIENLPLSRREKGRFLPAAFDEIRNLAKKSGGKLERYSSDDSLKWRQRLEEYGIFQSEWRMIEDLNSDEGGLSDYFGRFRTSDALIDSVLIPRIEEQLCHAQSRDDSSLETMLISYAKAYNEQQSCLREREICEEFVGKLKEAETQAQELWDRQNEVNTAVAALYAYADALKGAAKACRNTIEQKDLDIQRLEEEISRIRWERTSSEYYRCLEVLEQKTELLRKAEKEKEEAGTRLEQAKKNLRLIECAQYYGQLLEIESGLRSVTAEIESREKDSSSGKELAQLRYSALVTIRQALQSLQSELKTHAEEKERLQTLIDTLTGQLKELDGQTDAARTAADRAEAVLDRQKQQDDQLVETLGIETIRMLDGRFQEKDLRDWEKQNESRIVSLQDRIVALEEKIQILEKRQQEIPAELLDLGEKLQQQKAALTMLNQEIEQHLETQECIRRICEKHSLGFDLRFTDHIAAYLKGQLTQAEADTKAAERKKEEIEEEIDSIKQGSLHIPKRMMDFLQASGVFYTTFETYLLQQQEKGLLTTEKVRQLLEAYPYAAYGIIVGDQEKEALLEDARGRWLPAVLPLFTAGQVQQMLKGDAEAVQALAAFSADYFLNRAEFEEKQLQSLSSLKERLVFLEEQRASFASDLKVAEDFAMYDKNWLSSRQAENRKAEEELAKTDAALKLLQQEYDQSSEMRSKLQSEIKECQGRKQKEENLAGEYQTLKKNLQEEETLSEALSEKRRQLRQLEISRAEKQAAKAVQDAELAREVELQKEQKTLEESLKAGLSRVEGAAETEILTGSWKELLDRYKALEDVQNADLKRLNEDKERLLKQKIEKEREISKRKCAEEEYAGLVYSEEKELKQAEEVSTAEKAYRASETTCQEAGRQQGTAEGLFKAAQKDLGEFGGQALPASQVGADFERRITERKKQQEALKKEREKTAEEQSELLRIQAKTDIFAGAYERPQQITEIQLEEGYEQQLDELMKHIRQAEGKLNAGSRRIEEQMNAMAGDFGEISADISRAVSNMQELLKNKLKGDRYFTLHEHICANLHTTELRINKITTDLREFDRAREDLVHQCMIQGKRIYEGLMQMSGNSRIRLQDKRRQMLRFDLPETVEEAVAVKAIADEIDEGAKALAEKMSEGACPESNLRGIAARTVGSRRLLRKYVGRETITLRALKIDRNPENSVYRTWEKTQLINSGSERFVVYMAVMLAQIAYARDSFGTAGRERGSSTLILDNPFGPITSRHVLEPLFDIARNYNVQMICLSDINNSDVVKCFDLVIRAVVKQYSLNNMELLTHEGNELIEHGYYKSEQLSLF